VVDQSKIQQHAGLQKDHLAALLAALANSLYELKSTANTANELSKI
jgi:hypothetical protein